MRLTHAKPAALDGKVGLTVLLCPVGRLSKLPCGELGQRAARLAGRKVFGGKKRETLLVHADGKRRDGPDALLLVGLGELREVCADGVRQAMALAVGRASELGVSKLVVGVGGRFVFDAATLQAAGEGAVLASYRYSGKAAKNDPPREVGIVSDLRVGARVLRVASAVATGANIARDLGDLPGNVATPRHIKNRAQAVARKGELRFKAHDRKALQKLGYGGILAVNQGTVEMPYLVEMDYKPAGYKHTLCIVGKGLSFDSGGISLKPSAKMEEMKYDMCGAGATIGLMSAVAALAPKGVRVVGIVGTTDNMPGPAAYKPGDVIKTGSGKTVEVINTDAEGRVVLSDCLHHATKFKPDAIVDMATLTGAILMALGSEAAGLFSNDDKLAARLMASSDRTDERLWRLPVYDAYVDAIKSRVADIKNSSGREAGSATAAAFLMEFSGGIPHAHLDIAGTAWNGPKRDYNNNGWATGFGVRLLWDLVSEWA